ncbi:MAG TPA: peptidylprolyl isomerase [Candidatus Gracilibacteria bacterium]
MNGNLDFATSLLKQGATVTLQTTQGDIKIKLFTEEAPKNAENFYALAKGGKYNDTIFHRVIDGFMIQGGDYENADGTGGRAYKALYLADEFSEKLSHKRGMVSMANKGPDTNASQFFIVQKDSTFLDGRHTIFGEVVEGMEVVDAIAKARVDEQDRPVREIKINRAIPKN